MLQSQKLQQLGIEIVEIEQAPLLQQQTDYISLEDMAFHSLGYLCNH